MGQKVRPSGIRLGIIRGWQSTWYADKGDYRTFLLEDIRIRKFIQERLENAGVTDIRIERRVGDAVNVTFGTSKPGIVIGRGGSGVELIKQRLEKMTGRKIHVNVQEVKTPELNAELTADSVANAIERRVSFRRAMRQAVQRTMKMGAKGIRVSVSGRLGGGDIARSETTRDGSIPLHTLRADIDYGVRAARTKHGRIGIKVWIYKGDVLPPAKVRKPEQDAQQGPKVRMAGEQPTPAAPAPAAEAEVPAEQAPAATEQVAPVVVQAEAQAPAPVVIPAEGQQPTPVAAPAEGQPTAEAQEDAQC